MVQKAIQYAIYLHAALGGLALLSGSIALIAAKGKAVHKRSGKIFYYGMLACAAMAMVIAVLPNHRSEFLFSIGVFSSYSVLIGYRALNYKRAKHNFTIDKIWASILLLTGSAMIAYTLIFAAAKNVVMLVFGIAAIYFAVSDLIAFQHPEKTRKRWLQLHLGKMTGGFIAALTAFVVVNQLLPGVWAWFVPSMVFVPYIVWQTRESIPKK